MLKEEDLLSIQEASKWASKYLNKEVTNSNIAYLIQYALIKKIGNNGSTQVSKSELKTYYESINADKKYKWKLNQDNDLNWTLSFDYLKEADTTKHVHRLHPYKGKFIPQLVEYFLDNRTDKFKTDVYFKSGDAILDPFCGSGTTLIQANELGMHSVGIDVSLFNTIMSNCKIAKIDLKKLKSEIDLITKELKSFIDNTNISKFEEDLIYELNIFNNKYFSSYDYKIAVKTNQINEKEYSEIKSKEFLETYYKLIAKHNIKLKNENADNFITKWFFPNVIDELNYVSEKINTVENDEIKNILKLILSRTMRSCRATTHSDLATLLEPVTTTYYCTKHYKICKPLFSIFKWWSTYSFDTVKRLTCFEKLKTDTHQICITGDSRNINILEQLENLNKPLCEIVKKQKISGIFSSPPYVGLIDYHEQHAYAYELFGYKRNDEMEIGPLYKGQGQEAKNSYVNGVSEVLLNCKKYMIDDYNVFLVANDKYNLYPLIAQKAGMKIVNTYKRPVLNRTEKTKNAYSEIIFHLKEE